MAKETRIKYRNKGFWINEHFVEVISKYLCEAFEYAGLSNFSQNLQDVYDSCDSNRSGVFIGMVNIPLNLIANDIDKAAFINVIEQAKSSILLNGTELSLNVLNQIENDKTDEYFKQQWHSPIKTQSLISTLNIIKQMLNGTWQPLNYAIYYTGFPQPTGGYVEV